MKDFFGNKLTVQKAQNGYFEIVSIKKWGCTPVFDTMGRHETFETRNEAKAYLRSMKASCCALV